MNTKMKVLSLAMVGAFGYVGVASAACPAMPGAWSASSAFGGGTVAAVDGGLDGSECKMEASITDSLASVATVTDNSPANESRYRVQFLIDPSGIPSFSSSASVQVFTANAAAAANGRSQIVGIYLQPGPAGAKRLQIAASCNNGSTFKCTTSTGDLPAGVNRIELDVKVGADGYVKYWLNAPAGTTEPTQTGAVTLTGGNAAWAAGVKTAILGLTNANPGYRNAHKGSVIAFDTFDSRRQTYISH